MQQRDTRYKYIRALLGAPVDSTAKRPKQARDGAATPAPPHQRSLPSLPVNVHNGRTFYVVNMYWACALGPSEVVHSGAEGFVIVWYSPRKQAVPQWGESRPAGTRV